MSSGQQEEKALSEEERRTLLRNSGNQLIIFIHALMKAAALHDINNHSLDRPAEGIIEALTQLRRVERAGITMNLSQGAVYLNANRLSLEQQGFTFVQTLELFFGRMDSSGLRFANDVTADQIKAYLHFANKWRLPAGEKTPLVAFRKALKEASLGGVDPTVRIRLTVDGEEKRLPGVLGLATYAKLVAAFSRLLAQPNVPLSLAQRLVQDLLDALRTEGDLLLALTLMPSAEMTFERRTVNTAILVLSMMQNLGNYSRALLSELGLAALLCRIPAHRRAAGGAGAAAADPEGAELWRPLDALGNVAELTPAGVRTLLAEFEQLKRPDGQGAPELVQPSPPLASSQLVGLAQELQDRLYPSDGKVPSRPFHEVISELLDHTERHAVESLVLLVQTIGVLPPGTLVELLSGEVGVVMEQERRTEQGGAKRGSAEGIRVRLLFDAAKERLPGQTVVVLGQPSPAGPPWRLRSVLDARENRQLLVQAMLDNPESVMLQLKLG